MERKESLEQWLKQFLVSLSYLNKREFKRFGMQGKFGFSRNSIEPVHFRSHAMTRLRMVLPT